MALLGIKTAILLQSVLHTPSDNTVSSDSVNENGCCFRFFPSMHTWRTERPRSKSKIKIFHQQTSEPNYEVGLQSRLPLRSLINIFLYLAFLDLRVCLPIFPPKRRKQPNLVSILLAFVRGRPNCLRRSVPNL